MYTPSRRTAYRLLGLLPAAVAFAYGPASMHLAPESKLWVDGTSTVRSWSCKATVIDATVQTSVPQAATAVLQGEKAVTGVDVRIPVEKLECGNGTMNGHLRKALKADQAPVIAFRLSGYQVAKAASGVAGSIEGQLTIGGVTKPITLQAAGSDVAGALQVSGSYELQMTHYGIKPPTLMLGTMKVGDKVKVGFDLLLQQ